jgi:acyl carrier protein
MATVTAVIGLAGRFPGEPTIEALWRNLWSSTGPATEGSGREPWISRVQFFLECALQAIEDAAYTSRIDGDRTGLFTGGYEGDSLATEVAGELSLRGPAVTFHSPACPALAAVDRACRSLRSGECDLALAGEVSTRGEGVGVVMLKRLPDAFADGDRILAVIRGSAIQESPEADSVDGGGLLQALAGIPAETIDYVAETRGDGMAGIGGLLTTVLAVERGLIPPALREWPDTGGVRRALVSALGPRGAAHVVLEQSPVPVPRDPAETEPGPVRERPVLANVYTSPGNRLEAAIASVWQEQLGIDRIGVDDNFFELGGTSVIGTRIIGLLKDWLHQDIPAVSLYEGPTVSALTKVLLHSGPSKGYDAVRERGERRRRKLQRSGQGV